MARDVVLRSCRVHHILAIPVAVCFIVRRSFDPHVLFLIDAREDGGCLVKPHRLSHRSVGHVYLDCPGRRRLGRPAIRQLGFLSFKVDFRVVHDHGKVRWDLLGVLATFMGAFASRNRLKIPP